MEHDKTTWSEEDQAFIVPELPGCVADGRVEAMRNVEVTQVDRCGQEGRPVPAPSLRA